MGAKSEQKSVNEGAGLYARADVYHHAGGFVHHQNVRIFVNDGQRQVFRRGAQLVMLRRRR